MSLKSALTTKRTRTNTQKEEALKSIAQVPTKRLNVDVPADVLNQFKGKAAMDGKPMSVLINQWIKEYLDS